MKSILAFVLCIAVAICTIPTIACNSTQALTEVERFEPIIINALVLACAVQSTLPVCGSGQATITGDYNLVIKLWSDWNAAVANGTSTVALWNDLNAAFATFEQDSAAIFAAASGLDAPEITAVVAAAQILLAAIEAAFPASPNNAAKPAVFKAHAVGRTNFDAKWLANWTADYNEKLEIAHRVHPNVKLVKVHYHTTAVRAFTLGIAK
jgi:hypothetical protein